MPVKDPRVDAYILKAQPFARPILKHIRKLVHEANPNVEETIKWGMPSFDYKGAYCNMAAFKGHVALNFWKAALLKGDKKYLKDRFNNGGEAMGSLGRITDLKDLPPDNILIDLILQAKKLNDEGIKLPSRTKTITAELIIPDYFLTAIKKNKKALATFENFSPSNKKEYITWITEAKTDATRESRLKQAIEWMSEGKIRNWKYIK